MNRFHREELLFQSPWRAIIRARLRTTACATPPGVKHPRIDLPILATACHHDLASEDGHQIT